MSVACSAPFGEPQLLHRALSLDGRGLETRDDGDAQAFDVFAEHGPRIVVELAVHEGGRVVDDGYLQAEVLERLGRLEAQQAAADDRAGLLAGRPGDHGLEVVDGPVRDRPRADRCRE